MNDELVISAVCEAYNELTKSRIKIADVRSASRKRPATICRQVSAYILLHHYSVGPTSAGKSICRDHATALHGFKVVKARIGVGMIEATIVALAMRSLPLVDQSTEEADGELRRAYVHEVEKNRALSKALDIERKRCADLSRDLYNLKCRYDRLKRDLDGPEVDEWTPEQRRALAEFRKGNYA